jgi:hypothetical protein
LSTAKRKSALQPPPERAIDSAQVADFSEPPIFTSEQLPQAEQRLYVRVGEFTVILALYLDGLQRSDASVVKAAEQKLWALVPDKPRMKIERGPLPPADLHLVHDRNQRLVAHVTMFRKSFENEPEIVIHSALDLLRTVVEKFGSEFKTESKINAAQAVSDITIQADVVLDAWVNSKIHEGGVLTQPLLLQMAQLAVTALRAAALVDPNSGLVLPPTPGKPYRERRHHPDGRRLNVLEHLQEEYGPYIEAGLLFSGHLQEIDKPAYQALLYLAEKEAKARGQKRGSNTAEFCLRHGVLTSEHVSNPPLGRERQIQLIKQLHAKRIERGLLHEN